MSQSSRSGDERPLEALRAESPRWGLAAFVAVVNARLVQTLPARPRDNTKLSELFNPRLVRYYTTVGLIAPPERAGKEARYTYLHLLQALVIRRMLFEGFTAPALRQILAGKSLADYEALLSGSMRVGALAAPVADPLPVKPVSQPESDAAVIWRRAVVVDGVELHIRGGVRPPDSVAEIDLAMRIADRLRALTQLP